MASDVISPAVEDGYGYRARYRDLTFLRIEISELERWRREEAPLGMNDRQYSGFVHDLVAALRSDGLALNQCDVRLKGSSAEFYSGYHKKLPVDREETVDLFRDLRERAPSIWEVEEIEDRLNVRWIDDGIRPTRRPFDSMYRLGIDREKSDVDLQVSSDAIHARSVAAIEALGLAATAVRIKHPTYNFIRKDLVESTCEYLYAFTRRASDQLGRNVTVAAFPRSGPPDTTSSHGPLSAHFRPDDWIIDLTFSS